MAAPKGGEVSKQSVTQPELEAAMQRFFALAPADQLRAYEQMREYLSAAAKETKADRDLRERIEALEAITG